ncbi:T-cell surface antigen CD2-like isoform X2 [Salvelinus namaycush]|uniref:T-cell surface antigen CD2-like isoform X2 n=1 Tax=Salvelinus namaycush TaxID=8040 RepID=A0A8U0R3G9_SALNM|nr:T-cell surface antigen CD2-like isoform X2 [Salvelinus namaycush]
MSKLTLIRLCFWLYLVRTVVSEEYLYLKVGGELVLTPDKSTVPDPITSILWRHGRNKVAEWDQGFGLDIYGAFKERTTLDQTTGELRIKGLMKTDSGVYSVEFNSKQPDKTYKLSVIKAVPKPTITSSCNANQTSCTLTCEGDTTDAEPVTYSWKVGERAWEVLYKQRNVSKSNTGKSTNGYKYICKLKNAVSEEVSEVFGPESSSIGAVVALVVCLIVVFAVITGMLVWKKKTGYPQDTWINFLRKYFGGMFAKGSDVVQPEQGKGNADKAEKGKDKPSRSNSPKDESKPEAKGSDVVQSEQEATLLKYKDHQ